MPRFSVVGCALAGRAAHDGPPIMLDTDIGCQSLAPVGHTEPMHLEHTLNGMAMLCMGVDALNPLGLPFFLSPIPAEPVQKLNRRISVCISTTTVS